MKIYLTIIFLIIFRAAFSQSKIGSVDISGNDYFTDYEIQNMMVSKKDGSLREDQFNLDLKTIRDKYKSSGFLFMKFDKAAKNFSEDSAIVDITLEIKEGSRINIGIIEIKGNRIFSDEEILNLFSSKKGSVLNDNLLNEDINE